VNADWLGAPRLHTLRTIGVRDIKTWRAFGAPSQWRENYFWTGGKTGNAKLMRSFEFGPRFCPRNERPLKKNKKSSPDLDRDSVPEISVLYIYIKKFFAGFGPRSCPRSKCSLKIKKKGLRRL